MRPHNQLQAPPPGYHYGARHARKPDTRSAEFAGPARRVRPRIPAHARLGWPAPAEFADPGGESPYPNVLEIPAFYTVSILLGGDTGAVNAGSVTIRPEPFVCRRITWSTTGDTPVFITVPSVVGSAQGRAVEVSWSDELTKFRARHPARSPPCSATRKAISTRPVWTVAKASRRGRCASRACSGRTGSDPATTRRHSSFQGVGPPTKGATKAARPAETCATDHP